eukprot:1184998-Prorocentrum_minimum.AAC.2
MGCDCLSRPQEEERRAEEEAMMADRERRIELGEEVEDLPPPPEAPAETEEPVPPPPDPPIYTTPQFMSCYLDRAGPTVCAKVRVPEEIYLAYTLPIPCLYPAYTLPIPRPFTSPLYIKVFGASGRGNPREVSMLLTVN